ncbi:MAG: M48 family metalloprotease [Saprospiraceae bacterium]|nr:M48 family metalloprotease [Saprospiraceae bacterium]
MSQRLFLLLLFLPLRLAGQEFMDLVPREYCLYWGDSLETELIRFAPNESVPQAVDKILAWAGREANFELVQCNAGSVAAVVDGEKRYLLYSQHFFYALPTPAEAYALLAHEIGHHLYNHHFESCCRRGEEWEADQFMGFILFKTNLTDSLSALDLANWRYEGRGFSRPEISVQERQTAIARGWARAEVAILASNHMAYYENQKNMEQAGLRSFPWPPPACAERYTIKDRLNTQFATLRDVDQWLQKALENRRYWSRSYRYLPNGFALITRLEQFNEDGSSKADPYRWVDYPVAEGSGGILDYLYSLILPRKGFFRVFVFAVTDQSEGSNGQVVDRAQAQKWLENASSQLPHALGARRLNEEHFVEVLVYEFQVSESTLKAKSHCPCAKPCREHLEKSGLLGRLR